MKKYSTLRKQLKDMENISFTDAKKLYTEYANASDEEKTQIMERLVLGTTYVVFDYIDYNFISKIDSASFDIEDVETTFIHSWTKLLQSGEIINHKNYYTLIKKIPSDTIYNDLVGEDIYGANYGWIDPSRFSVLLCLYAYERREGKTPTRFYEDEELNNKLFEIYDSIYNKCNLEVNDISPSQTYKYYKILLSNGFFESISKRPEEVDTEEETRIVEDIFSKEAMETIDTFFENDMEKDIVYGRNGFYGKVETYEELALKYGITVKATKDIVQNFYRKVRKGIYKSKVRAIAKTYSSYQWK